MIPRVPPFMRFRRSSPSISDDSPSTAVNCTRFILAESERNSAAARSMRDKTSASGSAGARTLPSIKMENAIFTSAGLLLLGKRQVTFQFLFGIVINRLHAGDHSVPFILGIHDSGGARRQHVFGYASQLLRLNPISAAYDGNAGGLRTVAKR